MRGADDERQASRLILVGRVAGAFGVKGELKIASYTDDPVALVRYRDLKGSDGAPAPTAMQRIDIPASTGFSGLPAQTSPVSAVKITSDITRGFSSRM